MTSHNPHDVEYKWCGRCKVFHDDIWPPAREWWLKNTEEKQLEDRWPLIKWRQPIAVTVMGQDRHYVCRFCIALHGLHAKDVGRWPRTPELFHQHLREEHGL